MDRIRWGNGIEIDACVGLSQLNVPVPVPTAYHYTKQSHTISNGIYCNCGGSGSTRWHSIVWDCDILYNAGSDIVMARELQLIIIIIIRDTPDNGDNCIRAAFIWNHKTEWYGIHTIQIYHWLKTDRAEDTQFIHLFNSRVFNSNWNWSKSLIYCDVHMFCLGDGSTVKSSLRHISTDQTSK